MIPYFWVRLSDVSLGVMNKCRMLQDLKVVEVEVYSIPMCNVGNGYIRFCIGGL